MISFAAGLSIRPGAHLVRDVARRVAAQSHSRRCIAIHETPHISTWIAGFAVGIPAGIWDIGTFADLSNIGTLFAFIVVSAGVIVLREEAAGAAARIPRAVGPVAAGAFDVCCFWC